jgi:hypothetical protein
MLPSLMVLGLYGRRKKMLTEGIIFGLIDNGVLIIGALFGLSIEKYLPEYFHNGVGTMFGAGIGNAISDWLGGLAVSMGFAWGALLGCLAALILIPGLIEGKKLWRTLKKS